ncbi:hypothetical protein BYT27DRAFT_7119135, partial [Phlegmacium glaucopus]
LSDKERAELVAAGKCFNCKEPGHLSRNCPQRSTVRSNGPKPPGASNFSIEPVAKHGIDSDEFVDVLDSLPLGSVNFEANFEEYPTLPEIDNEWRANYPEWQQPGIAARRSIGDSYAMVAVTILTLEQPYPGDEFYQNDVHHQRYRSRTLSPNFEVLVDGSILRSGGLV